MDRDVAIRMEGVSKTYQLGEIDRALLRKELKARFTARRGGVSGVTEEPEFYALRDVDLTVHRGETLGIIGRNGAGKSTLLKLLSRITTPSSGEIDIYGRVASMLEVGTGFHGDMTGRENIFVNGTIMGMTRAEIRSKLQDIIDFSEIGGFIDTPVKRYSSGMYVKLGFAIASHLESEIVVMDEVLAVGDVKFQQKCLDKMRQLASQDGRTVLYVSHNMNTVRALCDRCIVLQMGRKVFDGDVSDAVARYMYLDDAGSMRKRYFFDETARPYVPSPQQGRGFTMEELEILSPGEPVYESDASPAVRLTCLAETSRAAVGFRLEVWYQDGTKVGSMVTSSLRDMPAGWSSVTMRLDLSLLTDGQYRCDLIAYQLEGAGQEHVLDRVYPGLVFAVQPSRSIAPFMAWNHQYWGHIRLGDITLEP